MPEIQEEKKTGARLRSMTGYADAVAEQDGMTLAVSLRSVNHKFLDLHVYLPEPLQPLERKIRREIQERNPRGRLELKVVLERAGAVSLNVDEGVLERYIELFRRLGAQYGMSAATDVSTLCRLPGVVNLTGAAAGGRTLAAQLEAPLFRSLRETLDRWDEMRAAEARFLFEDMEKRVQHIVNSVTRLDRLREDLVPAAQKRVQERLQALLGSAGLDATRLAQEAALLADRADTSEEILRLQSHVARFAVLLDQEADAGRKVDFLLQEMHRELNTFLSKTAALGKCGLPLTEIALEVKAEVEKLREQAQNLQ